MRIHRSIQCFVTILALAGLTACATSGEGMTTDQEPTGDGISIQVRNDLTPPTGIVVWAVPEAGNRRRLGFISPNGRGTFNYSPQLESMQVYLLAVPEGPTAGTMGQMGERRSNLFPVLGVRELSWTVSQPNVRIGG